MATITIPTDDVKYVDNNNNDRNKFVDDEVGKYLSIFGEKKWFYTQLNNLDSPINTEASITRSSSTDFGSFQIS